MLKLFKFSVTLTVFLLALVPILAIAQGTNNTVLNTTSPLPGGGFGTANVVIGPGNLYSDATLALYNVFVGGIAGRDITTGKYNVFTGYAAGLKTTTGTYNVFTGYNAGYQNTTGSYNSFVGTSAGYNNTTGVHNTFTGYHAGHSNTTGNYNSFVGYQAGRENTTANYNAFFGYTTGYENTTGTFNSFLGGTAGRYNTTGSENTFVGFQSGFDNTTGNKNSFLGRSSGRYNTTGVSNVFLGFETGFSNTTGGSNSFMGNQAGYSNTTGNNNSFLGTSAGRDNTVGNANSFIGMDAGNSNISGFFNSFMGSKAGFLNTTGIYNSFLGTYAGQYNKTGNYNSFVGTFADAIGANQTNLQRATALGYRAKVGVDDGLVLGDTSAVKVGIGTAYPNQRLTLRGNMNFVAYDNSLRLKNQPFLHFNEHESLALGLGAEIAPGAEKTLVLGSEASQVKVPGRAEVYALTLSEFGNTKTDGQFLSVDQNGKVVLAQPRVQIASVADWSDKVFVPGYALRPLDEVEEFVKKNKHLPGVPSAEKMVAEGMESAAFNAKLLEKIEELTLYVVDLEKKNAEIRTLREEVAELKGIICK